MRKRIEKEYSMVRLIAFPLQGFRTFVLMNTGHVLLLLLLLFCNYLLSDNYVNAFVAIPKIIGCTRNVEIETRDLRQQRRQQQQQQQQPKTILTAFGRSSSSSSSSSKSLSFLLRNNSKDYIAHSNDCIDNNQIFNPTIRLPQAQTKTQQQDQSDRRNVLFRMGTRALLTTMTVPSIVCWHPSSALALKKKNEVLCGTGFFEHIYEYKCTSIGDIEDEGTSKELSRAETGVTDNLMGKFGFDTDDVIKSSDYYNRNNNNNNYDEKIKKKGKKKTDTIE
jgi:hypothetical protein